MNFKDGYSVKYPIEYSKYKSILQRTNPLTATKKSIENYVNKGITCSPERESSFKAFMEDMGPCPDGYEIDRRNNKEGYSKENCRWVIRNTNQYNRGKSKNNLSPYPKGVRYNKKINKYTSQICIDYTSYHLGSFLTVREAEEAYNKIALEWYGFINKGN